ncbi:MAG: DEAD/DEAH box helicase family protein [Bacteroidetes bacterium]|nr:DEAD/DEAH box helicase family protein [Bacteroidota bacterium]
MAEAKARIKINKLLEEAGWRFFDDNGLPANIVLESNTKITQQQLDSFGDNYEQTTNGFIDYLLLDSKGFPQIVLEAKKEEINPLFAKEQARKYATAQKCRFVILSNGNQHYLWDLQRGNPNIISKFPTPETVGAFSTFNPNPQSLIAETVKEDYIVTTQKPNYAQDPRWIDETQRKSFLEENKLRLLRYYQVNAIQKIQEEVKKGKDRFLFEMATGTGKTLTAAAVIKLFLRTGNARRVLFLVDRLELEDQADKAFKEYLRNDYQCCIYKENRDDWRKNEIVVSTVQSFLFKNKYKRIFAPTDFDLVISDEAHRSIGGNSRAVFEYFIGYKLGLTATPKDYLKKIDPEKLNEKDPRELERRMLLDTYTTFGCADGKPTFQYSLLHGVKDGFLVNPIVADARTEITTQLLSDEGYSVTTTNEEGKDEEEVFGHSDFEKKFFSENTNRIFCNTFLKNALTDPVTGEIGKTIVFCVSQNHAAKITQILNVIADQMFPNKYQSDFAIQVTSRIQDAQQFTINFTNNNLSGTGNFNPLYKTSKTRVCVTVGMMTTGYDCPDLLNVCLMRPIFSPTDFIQIKGRGTRKHNFLKELLDKQLAQQVVQPDKKNFKLFDFFANCEYFETEFNYDEILKLPPKGEGNGGGEPPQPYQTYDSTKHDPLKTMQVKEVGLEGMKIDRMYFDRFEEKIKEDAAVQKMIEKRDLEAIEKYILQNIFEKPEDFYNLTKLQTAAKVDRKLTLREIIEKMFGFIPYFKSKDELLEDEFEKFDSRYLPDEQIFYYAKNYFKSYITDKEFREIIDNKNFALLNTNPNGEVFRKLTPELRNLIPQYINENISINNYTA